MSDVLHYNGVQCGIYVDVEVREIDAFRRMVKLATTLDSPQSTGRLPWEQWFPLDAIRGIDEHQLRKGGLYEAEISVKKLRDEIKPCVVLTYARTP